MDHHHDCDPAVLPGLFKLIDLFRVEAVESPRRSRRALRFDLDVSRGAIEQHAFEVGALLREEDRLSLSAPLLRSDPSTKLRQRDAHVEQSLGVLFGLVAYRLAKLAATERIRERKRFSGRHRQAPLS